MKKRHSELCFWPCLYPKQAAVSFWWPRGKGAQHCCAWRGTPGWPGPSGNSSKKAGGVGGEERDNMLPSRGEEPKKRTVV